MNIINNYFYIQRGEKVTKGDKNYATFWDQLKTIGINFIKFEKKIKIITLRLNKVFPCPFRYNK
jgi:hypothetical protein